MRLFIAVPLPPAVGDRAAACLPPALPALRPVRPELMHLTLAFIGQVPAERLRPAVEAAQVAARDRRAFEVSVDHAGRFPAAGRPRAIWLGIGSGRDELASLAATVAQELVRRSFTLEDRPFAPHLTLARVRPEASGPESRTIATAIDALAVPEIRFDVDHIAVVESRLSPRGPTYTARALVRLGAGG